MSAQQSLSGSQFSHLYQGPSFDLVRRLYGKGQEGFDRLFTGHTTTITPWPHIGKSKQYGLYTPEENENIQTEIRRQPPQIREFDPRELYSSQSGIAQSHVRYYLTDEYQKTGRTSADQHALGNQYPVILQRSSGRNAILSGHHRATAALLRGVPLRGIAVPGF